MPTYRFSWSNFDDATVSALARALGGPFHLEQARPWLEERVKRPSLDFVRATKDVLARVWLPKHIGIAKDVFEALHNWGIGPLGPARTGEDCARYVDACRNSKTVQHVLCEALIHFGDADAEMKDGALDFTGVRRFARIDPRKQSQDPRTPHPHQVKAWEALDAHLAESAATGTFRGMLVMPTGAGKTYSVAHWAIRNVINRGEPLVWLTHGDELLNQAARELTALAGLASNRDSLRLRVVSSKHCRAHQIDPADDIVVCSVGSLARANDVALRLASHPNLFIIVDEAHHAPARSYRNFIEKALEHGSPRILGITATPTRTNPEERPTLARLFDERTIYEVEPRTLIEQGILARPVPIRVRTGVAADAGATGEDLDHVQRFGDLSEEMLDRIGRMTARNELIVQTYLEGRLRYGKTLIFAVNVTHAAHLAERLKEEGVRADYVASWSPDGLPRYNAWLIDRFRKTDAEAEREGTEADGPLDVLVNVAMMTEGVDVPAVSTVFLARPTQSEIRLRQMVGRGLRGPAAGGSETAYLVSFEDLWEQFEDWDSLLDLLPDLVPPPVLPGPPPGTLPPDAPSAAFEPETVSWEQIREVARAMRHAGPSVLVDAFESVPHGHYVIEHVTDGEPVRFLVSRYAHQEECWDALLAMLDVRTPEELAELEAEQLHDEIFFDCEPIRPSVTDVARVLDHYRSAAALDPTGGRRPGYHPLTHREACDPRALARRIQDEDMGEKQRVELVAGAYTSLAQVVYASLTDFRAAVDAALRDDGSTTVPMGRPIFEPPPTELLPPGPAHDLDVLLGEMLLRGRELLGHDLPGNITVSWSRRLIKGWYAKAYFRYDTKNGDGEIRVNMLLDSPAVSPDTVRYVLWHEYLHLFLKAGHTEDFRKKEKLWLDWVARDRELDALNERFGVRYW
jgi:superfamily II DNA or RNA helicase